MTMVACGAIKSPLILSHPSLSIFSWQEKRVRLPPLKKGD